MTSQEAGGMSELNHLSPFPFCIRSGTLAHRMMLPMFRRRSLQLTSGNFLTDTSARTHGLSQPSKLATEVNYHKVILLPLVDNYVTLTNNQMVSFGILFCLRDVYVYPVLEKHCLVESCNIRSLGPLNDSISEDLFLILWVIFSSIQILDQIHLAN